MKLTKTFATAAAVAGLAVGATAEEEPSIAHANFRKVALMEVPGYTESETLQDFPVLARLGISTVPRFSYADCDPNSMRFFLSDGTVLAHEVDMWNPDGESLVWVRFPKLEKGCVAYLGWDPENPSALPAVSAADVWSAYDLVWHLNENLLDATGKGIALTPINSPTAVVEGGILGRHYVNSAPNQGLVSPADISTDILPKGSVFTVSAWFRSSYEASAGRLISNKVGDKKTDGFECVVWTSNNNKVFYRGKQTSGGDHYTPSVLTKNVWSYTACSFTGPTTATAWLNSEGLQSSIGCVAERNSGSPYVFGNNAAVSVDNGHLGDYDELRISPGHSQTWLKTEYATVANGRAFCLFTASENPLARLDARAYRKMSEVSVSNASTQVLFNFPVLLRLSRERVSGLLPRQIGENGYGLAFGAEDNTLLHYEVDTWNPDGESLVWVCLNEFRPGLNTFKMYWRKSRQPVSVNRPELVWGKYAGVWHLNNPDEDGVTVDSTGLGLKTRLTTNSLPIVVADNGFLGRGMRNTDVYQGVKIDPLPAHVFPAAISVSAWFKPSTGSSGVQRLVSAQGVDEQQVSYLETFELQVANGTLGYRPKFEVNAQGQKIGDPYLKQPELQNYTQGVWHRFTVQTRFNGSGSLWIDDTRLGYWAESTWLQPTAANCAIGFATKGGINEDDGLSFLGEYDELRLSGMMSDDWVLQEYRSLADHDFAVFSPAENTPWNRGTLLIIR